MSTASTVRKFLFPLHLWSGLILGIVIVLIGLSGSIGVFAPLFSEPPAVQVTAADIPALNNGLAAARAAVGAPQWANASITLPKGSHDPVIISFGSKLPMVATDPGTGRVLATFSVKRPAWFTAILRFHGGLLVPGRAATVEGWFGLAMIFLGLTGLYLWWPKAGRWKYAFIVRRTAKGLRFHRELHAAAGIWTLVIYLLVTTTGLVYGFPETTDAVIKFVTGEADPRFQAHLEPPTVPASAGATIIGPDAAFAAANKASGRPALSLTMPGWKPGQPTLLPIIAQTDVGALNRIYLDPYHNTIIPNPDPPSNSAYNMVLTLVKLHIGYGFGPIYTVLVFISGLMPLIFFVTGVMMWLKKRRARLAMNQPIPDSAMEG
jgi:uncharacterized iron-regulated membrane protein